MSPTGHLAMGFAAKGIEPKIPLWSLLVSSYAIDLIYFIFLFLGLDTISYAPWSHSLLMAVVWTVLAALITYLCSRKVKISVVIGFTVFSHWILDFIVWKKNLLAFDPSVTFGIGLYDFIGFSLSDAGFNRGSIIATSIEGLMLIIGIAVYAVSVKKLKKVKKP